MLNKSFQIFFKGTGLFILILLFHFKINAQNFNETDGRNANTIAVESSQGESKKNTQQAINPGTGTSQSEAQIRESAKILLSSHQKNRKSSFRIKIIQLTLQEQYPKIRVEKLLSWQKFKVGVVNLNSKFKPTSPRLVKLEKKYALRLFLRNLSSKQTLNKSSLKQNWHEKLKEKNSVMIMRV